MDFTVEVVLAPVADDDGWTKLRDMLDLLPGTLLIEDAGEPMLIFPVEAESAGRAGSFIDGVASIAELQMVSGCVRPTPPVDFERDGEESGPAFVGPPGHRWEETLGPDCEARLVH